MTDQTSETTPDGLDVAAVRERVKAATEGPWEASLVGIDPVEDEYVVQTEAVADVVCRLDRAGEFIERPMAPARADAEFIAHARTDVELLLAALDEARAEVEERRRQLAGFVDAHATWIERNEDAEARAEAAESARDAAEGVVREVRTLEKRWAEVLRECKETDPKWVLDRSVTTLATAHADLRAVLDRLAPVTADATEGGE